MVFIEKIIESETIYEGKILNLRKDKVTVNNGTATREIVWHNGGSVILPVDEEERITLCRQFRNGADQVLTELPAGKIDKGEDPLETAKRELEEETGLRASSIEHLMTIFPSPGYCQEKLYIYVATDFTKVQRHLDDHEEIDLFQVSLEEAVDMIIDGRIIDGKSIAGIMTYYAKKIRGK